MSIVQKQSSPIRTRSRIVLSDSKGPLRCVSCGYEIVSYRSLPSCPMCQETNWAGAGAVAAVHSRNRRTRHSSPELR